MWLILFPFLGFVPFFSTCHGPFQQTGCMSRRFQGDNAIVARIPVLQYFNIREMNLIQKKMMYLCVWLVLRRLCWVSSFCRPSRLSDRTLPIMHLGAAHPQELPPTFPCSSLYALCFSFSRNSPARCLTDLCGSCYPSTCHVTHRGSPCDCHFRYRPLWVPGIIT